MPDFGAPVVTGSSAINPIQTLSSIYGLQTAQAQATVAQQNAKENQALAGLMKDPVGAGVLDTQGNPTPNALEIIQGVAPTTGAVKASQFINAAKDGVAFRTSLNTLNEDQRTSVGNVLSGVASNHGSREDYFDALQTAVEQNPGLARAAISIAAKIPRAPDFKGDGQDSARAQQYQTMLDQFGAGASRAVNAPGSANVAPSITPVQTAAGIQPTNVNPMAPGGTGAAGPPVRNAPAPGANTFQDQAGNTWAFNPQNPGQATLVGHGGGAGTGNGSGGASPNAPQRPPVMTPGEPATIADVQKEVQGLRSAGTQIGTNRDINRRILSLVGETSTGPGTEFVHKAAAVAGLPAGASYQELNSFLDRQAAQAANAMGLPNTNMGLETSKQFTGNTQLNNKVIADKTKFVDSLNDAAQKYLAGANNAVGTGPNPNYTAYQGFRAKWSQNFDPEVFAYENAVKNGDKADQSRIESLLGQRGMAQLRQKRQALIGAVNGQ